MSEERLWIGGSCIYPESELQSCCRWTIYRSGAADSGESVECGACGMHWHVEGTIRDYGCGCSIGPEFTYLCKEADDLEARSHDLVNQWGLDLMDDDEQDRLQREIRLDEQEHLAAQQRAGNYREVPERVMFAHSEPDAEAEK